MILKFSNRNCQKANLGFYKPYKGPFRGTNFAVSRFLNFAELHFKVKAKKREN